jgi:hypothetical protein
VLDAKRTSRFKKEFVRMEKRGKNMDKLVEVMALLINEQPLLARHHAHPLRTILACNSILRYNETMEPKIIFAPSAFKHGVTEQDIRHAYKTKIHGCKLEGSDNKYAFIGFNRAANPIEVFYNPIGDDMIKVFHAMGCRNGVLEQIRD